MVYGLTQRSHEADVVVWDALNFPRLAQGNAALLFAPSARMIIEVKSRWSLEEFADIRTKCLAAQEIESESAATLHDRVDVLERHAQDHDQRIARLEKGERPPFRPEYFRAADRISTQIVTAAVVFAGGEQFTADVVTPETIGESAASWPQVMLLLGPG